MENFKVGDVVCLNSATNIKLTVTSIEGDYLCVSYYSAERQKFECEKFPIDAVSIYQNKNRGVHLL
ncbi:hypothetical protein [Bacteroides ihuae]|uniref:hypothetical protein n=1 Tax=Bacteroides ihuae TaxID=1852362 RepID=UPI0008DB3379|nr:hypothetical protein [Bacteroides ihuae]